MKPLYESLIIAFAMYTRIPMPATPWHERNLRGAVAFLPLVGAVIGALQYGLFLACRALGVTGALYAALALALPVLVTGGLHLDGFCDVTDALSAHAEREKSLAILSDPHVGAFALIYTGVLLVVRYGAWQQLYATPGQLVAVCCGYVLARAMAGVLIVHAPKAKSTGLAALFAAPAGHGRTVALSIWCVAAMALPVLLGGGVRALLVPVLALVLPVYVYRMAKARFGGITGDLAGYYIALSETLLLVLAALLGAPA